MAFGVVLWRLWSCLIIKMMSHIVIYTHNSGRLVQASSLIEGMSARGHASGGEKVFSSHCKFYHFGYDIMTHLHGMLRCGLGALINMLYLSAQYQLHVHQF